MTCSIQTPKELTFSEMSQKFEILIKTKIHLYRFIYPTKFSKPAKFHNNILQTLGNMRAQRCCKWVGPTHTFLCTYFWQLRALIQLHCIIKLYSGCYKSICGNSFGLTKRTNMYTTFTQTP